MTPLEKPEWLIALMNVTQDINEGSKYMCIEEYIISVHCIPDDLMKKLAGKLRQRGGHTSLTDAEVITMKLAGTFIGTPLRQSDTPVFQNPLGRLAPWAGHLHRVRKAGGQSPGAEAVARRSLCCPALPR